MIVDAKDVARHPHSARLTRPAFALYLALLDVADDWGRLPRGAAVSIARRHAGDQGVELLRTLVTEGFLDRYPPGGLVAILTTQAEAS